MKIEVDFSKSLEKNAERFFEEAKRAKKKLAGLQDAIVKLEREIEERKKKSELQTAAKSLSKKRSRDWFEKFRWFFTSDNKLVIGGRDAASNELIVKKFLAEGDIFFHADVVGAPHCVLKTEQNKAPEESIREALAFALIFSRAWKSGSVLGQAYWVLPSQVSKKAPSGESIGKGAFMIYGNRNYAKKIVLECGIGIEKVKEEWRVLSGPFSAIRVHGLVYVKLIPGEEEKGRLAKKLFALLQHRLSETLPPYILDELVAALPSGGSKIVSP